MEPAAVERAVQEQAKQFAIEKPYLVHLWDTYVPWAWEGRAVRISLLGIADYRFRNFDVAIERIVDDIEAL